MDKAFMKGVRGEIDLLVVSIPPRYGKSDYFGEKAIAWYLGAFPDRKVIYASYETNQAAQYGERSRKFFDEFVGPHFNLEVDKRAAAKQHWQVEGHKGEMNTAGVGGPLTGKGGNLLIIDDPHKNPEQANSEFYREKVWDWFDAVVMTRLEKPAFVVLIHTRWHPDDLIGRVIRELAPKVRSEIITLPAIAEENDYLGRQRGEPLCPEIHTLEQLEKIKAARSDYWWQALYQQRPTRHKLLEWPEEYFRDILTDTLPHKRFLQTRVQTLDPSKGKERGDYSAIVMAGVDDAGCVWVDADLDRRPVESMVERYAQCANIWKPHLLGLESNAWQDLLSGDLENALRRHYVATELVLLENRIKKEDRIRRIGPFLKQGRLRIANTEGGRMLLHQLQEFPMGSHDDAPDALEMCFQLFDMLFDKAPETDPIADYEYSFYLQDRLDEMASM